MGERDGGWDSDSDETVVEGSVIESDVEGEELHGRRLSFVNKDVSLTTEVRIDEGAPSPEICFIHKVHDYPYTLKEEKQINPIPLETNASDQSQSLLQSWINCPSFSENISESVFSLDAAVEGQQNNSVDLDIKVVGFLKDSEEKISQKLSDEGLSPETSLCLDAFLEELIMVPKEQTPQDIFPHVLEDCQRTSMTIIDTDNTVKERSLNNDTDLSLTSLGKIFMEAFSEQRIVTGEFEISDLLKPLSDSESPKTINPLHDMLECQGHALSIDALADEKSDALPAELVTALNSLSGSVVQPVTPEVPNKRQLSTEEEQLNSEPSIPQLDDDCTQLTDTFEPRLPTVQVEEIKAITGSTLPRTANEQLVGDSQREKEVISDYWIANSHEKPAGEGSSRSVETDLCAETTKATSRRARQLRETSSRKCRDGVSSCHQILQETQQRISHNGNTTRNKAKDFEKIQKSTSKDKQDLETNICHGMITLNGNRKAEQTRRSERIKKKIRQEASIRNSVNPIFPISLSRINRKNIFGETLLHKAVADEDVDLVCNIIKAGGNVNAQDYAGWTALHEASVEGLYRIANELLKAGADVNARGSEQITPLQDAVKEGHYELAELLLWYGADPLLKDEMGRCALEEASDQSMRKLLKSYIAKSRRDSEEISAGEDAESMLSAQSLEDTNLHQTELNSDGTVQHDHTKASKEGFAKNEQSRKTNLVTYTKNTVLQDLDGRRLNEENSKDINSDSKKTKKSVIDMAEAASKSKITQKDEGVFAEITQTEGTEKNKEERNAKSNVLSQFTETEAIQTKRVKLDPQETSQKTDLCSSSSKSKLSLTQSQFSQGSKQQTSKKSESSRKDAVVLHVAYNTRAWTKKRNAKGEIQLHIAAKRGDLSLVKTLISSGICVNEKDNAGWTAIHEASDRGFTEVILELLKAGANINSRSLDGTLPIHDAVSGNYLEAVRILLQHGANPHERDDSGETALDKACDDEMKELLKSYGAIDSGLSVKTTGLTERKYNHPTRSRRSKLICYDCCKNDDAALVPQREKYSAHESVAAIQVTEQKQKELLLLELRTSKDADAYIQKLSQIQDTLNEMLAKQKTERDALAKKYRASVESFKKGALREQLVKLASRQKSLLIVAQNQKELVQKIQNYRKEKQVYSAHSKKQISDAVICYGNGKGQDLTADKIMCPDVVTFSTGPGASMPNGNRVEAHLSLENRFSAQECSQHPNSCLAETGANKESIRSKEVSDHALVSENRVREYPFDNMSKLTNAVEVVTLPSEPTVSTTETKCLQQKDIDFVAIAEQGNKSLNPPSVTNTLNISEARSAVVSNNVCQSTSGCERVLAAEDLHRYVNKKDAFQQQQEIVSTSTENLPNTPQQMIFQSSVESFNVNSMLTGLVSNTDYSINLNQKSSSQSCSNQEYEQKQLKYRRNNRKKLQLIDLLELGRIKPGENVLEFKIQEFSHKATLLEDGKIKTSNRRILQNPVQWVKELLGSDISVTWKYVWNKVTYLGTQLSKFLVEEVSVSNDLELPSQQREPVGSSVQFNSLENLIHFLLFNEIVIVHKDEFLPCHIMEKHWNFYKECEDFGF